MTVPLNSAGLLWHFDKTLDGPQDKQDPRLDIVGKASLRGLPSATITNTALDPLEFEGKMYTEMLKAAGSEVTHWTYEVVAHQFFGLASLVPDAEKRQMRAAKELELSPL